MFLSQKALSKIWKSHRLKPKSISCLSECVRSQAELSLLLWPVCLVKGCPMCSAHPSLLHRAQGDDARFSYFSCPKGLKLCFSPLGAAESVKRQSSPVDPETSKGIWFSGSHRLRFPFQFSPLLSCSEVFPYQHQIRDAAPSRVLCARPLPAGPVELFLVSVQRGWFVCCGRLCLNLSQGHGEDCLFPVSK